MNGKPMELITRGLGLDPNGFKKLTNK